MTSPLFEIESGLHQMYHCFQDFNKYLEMKNELSYPSLCSLSAYRGRFERDIDQLLQRVTQQITRQQEKRKTRRHRYKMNKRTKEIDDYECTRNKNNNDDNDD